MKFPLPALFLANAFAFVISFPGAAHADMAYYLPFSNGGNSSLTNFGSLGGNGTVSTVGGSAPSPSTDVPVAIGDSHSYNFPANTESSPRGGVVVLPGGNSTFRMNTTGDQMTISTWVYWNGPANANGTSTSYIVSNMNASQNQGWALGISSSGRLRMQNSVGTVITNANATVLTTGTWNHVALRYTAGPGGVDPNFFINGEVISRGTTGFFGLLGTASTQTTRLSTIDGQYLALNGRLDDFAMWDNTLSVAKARALYTTPTALYTSDSINGYNAGVMNSLFTAYDALGSQTVGDLTWLYTTFDATGYTLGDTYSVGDNNYIYLGGNGTSASGLIAGPNTGNATVTLGNGTFIVTNRAELGTGTLQLSGVNLQASANMTGSNALTNPTWQLVANSQISGNNSIQLGTHIGMNSDYSLTNTLAAGRELLLGAIGLSSNASTGVTLTLNSTNSSTIINGVISNNGTGGSDSLASGLTITGSGGNTTLTGSNTYTGATRIEGGTLQIGAGGTSGSLATGSAISNNATLVFNRSNTVTQGADFASVISGTGNVTQAGSGTLVLSGDNTYTGATRINSGTLQIGAGGTSGSLATGGAISNNATLVFNRSNTVTQGTDFASVISGTGNVTQAGSGTLVLSGDNTYTGATRINSGTLQIGHANALGISGNISFAGGTLQYGSGITTDISSRLKNSASAIIVDTNSNNVTLANAIDSSNSGGLTKTGGGTLTLNASNTYTGSTTISAGTLQIGNGSTTGSISASSAISNNGSLAINRSDAITLSNTISGTGDLTKLGTNTLTLNGTSANTYSGNTTVLNGTLRLDKTSGIVAVGGDLLLSGSSKLLYIANKNEQIANTSSVTINGTESVFNGSTWNDLTGAVTVTETIGNLTVRNGQFNTGVTSNWTITGAGFFDGSTGDTRFAASSGSNTSFNSLSLKAMTGLFFYSSPDSFFINGNAGTLSTLSVGSGGLSLDGSTLVINMGANIGNAGSRLILDGNITTTGSTSSSINSTAGFTHGTGDVSLSSVAGNYTRTITTGSGANLTIALPITNGNATTAGILKDGVGRLTLTGNNTYTGATTINAGTLNVSSAGRLGGGNYSGEIINNGSLIFSTSSNQTLSGPISGTGSLTKENSGSTLTLSSANTFSGVTLVFQGTLVISHALALQNSIIDTVTPASFALDGVTAPTFGGLQGSRTLSASLGSNYSSVTGITLNTLAGVSTTYSGAIADGAANMTLTKTGDGTQILTGANTYNGSTTISAGTLQIGAGSTSGSISASSAISNNATLVINRSDAITLSNTISGTGNLTKLGTNTLTLSGASANTFNGTTTVSAGNLVLDKTSGIVAVGGNLVLNGSSQLRYGTNKNEQIADTASITLNGSQSVFNGSTWNATTGAVTVTETIANLTVRNGLFNSGAGNWTITGAGLFDGTSGDSRFAGFSGSRISFNSLSLIGMNGTTLAVTPDSFAINGNTSTLSTLLVGSGGLFLDGSNLVINRGLANGNVGSRLILDGNITTTGTSSSQILNLPGNNFGTADISLSSVAGNFTRTITTGSGANLTIALPITNGNATAAGILKDGAGTLFLSGTNTYTGATTISAGTLSIASVNNLGSTSGISLGDTGVLAYTGSAATLNRTISVTSGNGSVLNTGSGLLTLSGTLTKNGTTLRLAGGSGGITVSGAIVGSNPNSDLVIDGGSVTLASANSYNGPTALLNGATLTASVVNALPTANGRSAISIDATGTGSSTLALGASQSIASLSGAASSNVTLGSNTLTVGTTSGNTTFAGRITGTGGLVKDGASTLVLTGSNTYSGNTTVAGGTLQAASAGALANSSVVNVNSGSLLVTAGNSVNNNAAINLAGGTLALSGTFDETVGLLTLSANSVIDLAGFDGTLRFSGVGTWAGNATLEIWNWNGFNQYGTPVGDGANNRHVVFTDATGLTPANLANISFYSGFGTGFAGTGFEMGFSGGGTEIIPVPEPETYLTIIFMLSVLGFYKLRSLKRKPTAADLAKL